MAIERRRVMCCHCPMACGVVAEVDGDTVVRITGDPEHAVSRGFICIKGERAMEYHDHPDRLDRPRKRVGARGEGGWVEIGWEQAMDEIAERLAAIRDRHGAEAVALAPGTFDGADGGLGIRFMNLFGSPNTAGMGVPCAGPALEAESLTCGFGPTYVSPPVPGETPCIVVWGSRPSASEPPVWPLVRACHQAGARLIVVDPIRAVEAEAADDWLQLRPGTDGALALAWLHVIIGEGPFDRDFVARWGHGFEALAARVDARAGRRHHRSAGAGHPRGGARLRHPHPRDHQPGRGQRTDGPQCGADRARQGVPARHHRRRRPPRRDAAHRAAEPGTQQPRHRGLRSAAGRAAPAAERRRPLPPARRGLRAAGRSPAARVGPAAGAEPGVGRRRALTAAVAGDSRAGPLSGASAAGAAPQPARRRPQRAPGARCAGEPEPRAQRGARAVHDAHRRARRLRAAGLPLAGEVGLLHRLRLGEHGAGR